MKEFFKVTELEKLLSYTDQFKPVGTETVDIFAAGGRVLAEKIVSKENIPDFDRSTMDGYAVKASSTFGASEGTPAYIEVKGAIGMGDQPSFSIGPGQAAKISTGGMLPEGADAVVMVEHTDILDDTTIEVYKSVAPGQHVILTGEDIKKDSGVLTPGQLIRPQESGLLAALGKKEVSVFKKPVVGIISTGDEVVDITQTPAMGQIRDMNTYTLAGQVSSFGGEPRAVGIIRDNYDELFKTCQKAVETSDMLLISGGSSVGMRDFTIEVLSALASSRILAHGITISPGKPTILAKVDNKPVWGLPGHVASAMVVFAMVARPFLEKIGGMSPHGRAHRFLKARMARNVSSAQGRVEYVRVRIRQENGEIWAEPILGKSGLIHTMVQADGLVEIDMNTEGLDKGDTVSVIPL